MLYKNIAALLNHEDKNARLENLKKVKELIDKGEIKKEIESGSVNNHIHTTYSFSPYSPCLALFNAWRFGLETAGIMDHDSLSGAFEFLEASKILGIPVTCGIECRVKMQTTALSGKRINNPDQKSIAYLALHGIPHNYIDYVNDFFAPFRAKRNERNKKMCANINKILDGKLTLDFETDILPLSNFAEGGSVTERHILFGLAKKIDALCNTRTELVSFVENTLGLALSAKVKDQLLDEGNTDFYLYDLLGVLKGNLVEKFYIDADEECPTIEQYLELAKKTGAISAYAYLGDVGDSVTGDKKTQKFEDDYIDLLFCELSRLGFCAVTYMPTRNTLSQLQTVMGYCEKYSLFQISGEDINSPRQSFICKALENESFKHLYNSTYALIGHEIAASKCNDDGMFSEKTKSLIPSLSDRISHFEKVVKG